MNIENQSQLRDLYGPPSDRAKNKVLNSLEKHSKHFIEHSPFIVISTSDNSGNMDASPRGGEAGFVKITNSNEIIIPDFKGNNRIDSLSNILENKSIGLLFFIPGIDETLRINGSAKISTATKYLNLFTVDNRLPTSCILVSINEVFLHCAKAFMRSKLWDKNAQINPSEFPTMSEMLKGQLGLSGKVESRKDMIERYQKDI